MQSNLVTCLVFAYTQLCYEAFICIACLSGYTFFLSLVILCCYTTASNNTPYLLLVFCVFCYVYLYFSPIAE